MHAQLCLSELLMSVWFELVCVCVWGLAGGGVHWRVCVSGHMIQTVFIVLEIGLTN